MTRLLVSVRDVPEALRAFGSGADLIDVKEPLNGALGAATFRVIQAVVAALPRSATTSAVAGDHDALEPLVGSALAMAGSGVSFTKVGLGPGLAEPFAIAEIGRAISNRGHLVAVLFADARTDADLLPHLARAGFAGAMIDTRSKAGGRLTDLVSTADLASFVARCRAEGLMSGLAGSLRIEDISPLAAISPDYLGFRGGLCVRSKRGGSLDAARIRRAAETLRAVQSGRAA